MNIGNRNLENSIIDFHGQDKRIIYRGIVVASFNFGYLKDCWAHSVRLSEPVVIDGFLFDKNELVLIYDDEITFVHELTQTVKDNK